MPRGGGRGGGGGFGRGGGGFGGGRSPQPAPRFDRRPEPPRSSPSPAPRSPGFDRKGGSGGGSSPGTGKVIAGSFIGSALGSVLGNAISARLYEGRNPDTGKWEDPNREDNNPCKRELDYFLDCSKYAGDPGLCKGAANALKRCVDRHRDYFDDVE